MKDNISLILKYLLCPYCETPLKLKKVYKLDYKEKTIKTGILSCDCDEYPLIDGILYLKKTQDQKNHKSILLLKSSKEKQAKLTLLEESKATRALFDLIEHQRLKQKWLTEEKFKTLMGILKTINPTSKDWFTYLAHREQRATFIISLLSLAFVENKKNSLCVDLGCGAGQFLRFACENFTKNTWMGVDHSYSLLYLAREFIVPKDVFLTCADLNIGLPFKKESTDNVYVNDTFMSIHKKKQFLNQLVECLKKDGIASFNHIHNRGFENLGQAYAISPEEVKEMLQDKKAMFITDKELFEIITKKKFASFKPSVISELNRAQSYSFFFKKGKFIPRKIPKSVMEYVKMVEIDFMEDEHLNAERI